MAKLLLLLLVNMVLALPMWLALHLCGVDADYLPALLLTYVVWFVGHSTID